MTHSCFLTLGSAFSSSISSQVAHQDTPSVKKVTSDETAMKQHWVAEKKNKKHGIPTTHSKQTFHPFPKSKPSRSGFAPPSFPLSSPALASEIEPCGPPDEPLGIGVLVSNDLSSLRSGETIRVQRRDLRGHSSRSPWWSFGSMEM